MAIVVRKFLKGIERWGKVWNFRDRVVRRNIYAHFCVNHI